jgi:acyl-CoA thioesterase-1
MGQVLCFGDSIVQGLVDPEGGGWTQRLRRLLDRKLTFPVGDTSFPAHVTFNLGISDDTSEGVLARLERELTPRLLGEPTIVVIGVGTNEAAVDLHTGAPRHSAEAFAANLGDTAATARRLGGHLVLLELPPCDEARVRPPPWAALEAGEGARESYTNERIRELNRIVRKVAEEHEAVVAGCFEPMLAAGAAGLLHDGLHPNADGHQLLADLVAEQVEPLLRGTP